MVEETGVEPAVQPIKSTSYVTSGPHRGHILQMFIDISSKI
jgi:hypothetical protein